jgi:hypothetical protein
MTATRKTPLQCVLPLLLPILLGWSCASGSSIQILPVYHHEAPAAPAMDFMQAIDAMDGQAAMAAAGNPDQTLLAKALHLIWQGQVSHAEVLLERLKEAATDQTVKEKAWKLLAALATGRGDYRAVVRHVSSGMSVSNDFITISEGYAPEEYILPETDVAVRLYRFPGTRIPQIPVKVDGRTYRFILDTGSDLSIVSARLAGEIGLEPLAIDNLTSITSIGTQRMDISIIPQASIGQLTMRNHRVLIVPDRDLQFRFGSLVVARIDGILGMNALRELETTIDYRIAKVYFARPPQLGQGVPVNLVRIPISLVRLHAENGQALLFFLDSGSSHSYLTSRGAARVQGLVQDSRAILAAGVGGLVQDMVSLTGDVRLFMNGLSLVFRDMRIQDTPITNTGKHDGVLGADAIMAAGWIRLDFRNGVVSLGY